IRIGASQPTLAKVGSKPTRKVDAPMMRMVTRKVYFRPTRSPSRPKTRAPNGRTRKPAAKASRAKMFRVASLNIGCPSAPSGLRKFGAITEASEPKRAQSYELQSELE